MRAIQYERPDKSWGMRRVQLVLMVTPGMKAAVKNHAKRQSLIAGIQISVSNTVETTMLQAHDDMRKEANQINKEWKSNGRKYMDFKRSR